jgi:hypothetical protein
MLRCPECNGDDLIGGGFHSPDSIVRCRWCAAPAVEVPNPQPPRTAEQIMAIGRDLLEAGWQEALKDVLHDSTSAEVFLVSRMRGWVKLVKQFHRGQ